MHMTDEKEKIDNRKRRLPSVNPLEWIAAAVSLPLWIFRSVFPRRKEEELITYSLDGMDWLDRKTWRLKITGLVEEEKSLTWDEFQNMPHVDIRRDFHCITGWSVFDTGWSGVPWSEMEKIITPSEAACYVRFVSHGGYSASFKMEELQGLLLADGYKGELLPLKRGAPLRVIAPKGYYQFKGVKGLRRIEFTRIRKMGVWEMWGYGPSGKIDPIDRMHIKRLQKKRSHDRDVG